MKSLLVRGVSLSVLLCTFALQADVIKLKDGRAIQGMFLGGNSRQIDFLSPSGPEGPLRPRLTGATYPLLLPKCLLNLYPHSPIAPESERSHFPISNLVSP
jgi:hypothetical protein